MQGMRCTREGKQQSLQAGADLPALSCAPTCAGGTVGTEARPGLLACRNSAPELVPLHGARRHDCHPVGLRLQ